MWCPSRWGTILLERVFRNAVYLFCHPKCSSINIYDSASIEISFCHDYWQHIKNAGRGESMGGTALEHKGNEGNRKIVHWFSSLGILMMTLKATSMECCTLLWSLNQKAWMEVDNIHLVDNVKHGIWILTPWTDLLQEQCSLLIAGSRRG